MKRVLAVVKAKCDELTTITILEYDFNEGIVYETTVDIFDNEGNIHTSEFEADLQRVERIIEEYKKHGWEVSYGFGVKNV